jgi:hypothetical protein
MRYWKEKTGSGKEDLIIPDCRELNIGRKIASK